MNVKKNTCTENPVNTGRNSRPLKTIIHVNKHTIQSNNKHCKTDPPITIKTSKSNTYAQKANICDKNGNVIASVIHSPNKPLSCGAKVWIEVYNSDVFVEN